MAEGVTVTLSQERPPTAVEATPSDRVVTVPNALSVLRLLGVPLFLWLLLGPEADAWALGVLAASAATDYLDGKIARRFNQSSRLGELLDPAADRLYVVSTLAAFVVRDIVPLWLAVLLVARDVVLAPTIPLLKRHGYGPLPVHFLGKAATFNLLYAFPLLLLAQGGGTRADVVFPIAWGLTGWGAALYWWAGLLYLWQVRMLVREDRDAQPSAEGGGP